MQTLNATQQGYVGNIYPEVRADLAGYLMRNTVVCIYRQTECGADVPDFAVAPVEDTSFWIGCWNSPDEAAENALALGLVVEATLLIDGFAGRRELPCRVVGATQRRWRITADEPLPLPSKHLQPGDTALVPRHAVKLTASR